MTTSKLHRICTGVLILLACQTLDGCRTPGGKKPTAEGHVLDRGRVLVRVTNSSSQPLPGVRVELTSSAGARVTSVTAADGAALFEDLAEGRYSVRARSSGSRVTRVEVRRGLESTVFLTLETDDADTVIVKPKSR